jgi:hypothetical protein
VRYAHIALQHTTNELPTKLLVDKNTRHAISVRARLNP